MSSHSRVVSGRYPPPGMSPIADAIRERRGARGITQLDANLLHVPHAAKGYNSLLGAVRTEGKLPAILREAMILRIAALNDAAYEWIQHIELGRKAGLTNGQLFILRDTSTPVLPSSTVLGATLSAVVIFTDHSTRGPRVPFDVVDTVKAELKKLVPKGVSPEDEIQSLVEDYYVEAAMVVACYNMVSRFLLSTDVAGSCDVDVPWPIERKEHFVELPSFPSTATSTHTVHAITLKTNDLETTPWIAFANSLITSLEMWNYAVPYFLDQGFNILLHDQRGHGLSTLPSSIPSEEPDQRLTTIPLLAIDLSNLLKALDIPLPLHSLIGVSQGGATALAFANLYGSQTKSVIVSDTSAKTPGGNKEVWEERIKVVLGGSDASVAVQYRQKTGMNELADITLPRWFPNGSPMSLSSNDGRTRWLASQIANTPVDGFIAGARALGQYDVLDLPHPASPSGSQSLFDSRTQRVLLLAGSLDGDGKVAKGLETLFQSWNFALEERGAEEARKIVALSTVEGSGHLPMVDHPDRFCEVVGAFLKNINI